MMKSIISSLVLAVVITLPASGQHAGHLRQEAVFDTIDSFLRQQMQAYHVPALSVAIIENGTVRYENTYGMANLEYGIPNTPETAFQLASVTKLLSATALMTLVQDGKLDLQENVRHYLPELPESWASLKVMDLVAHQSGIADLLALKPEYADAEEALQSAMALPLDFEPGTKTVYAGGDYAVVMALIQKLTGMPFQQFLRERLLEPAGMEHTLFNNMEQDYIYRTYDIIPFAAPVYKWDEQQQRQRIFSMMFPSWTYPSGGLFSSLRDLIRWAVALDRNTLLAPEIQELMWTPALRRDGSQSDFGVGWIVAQHRGQRVTGHSGGPALADIFRVPGRKITVIVLTNQLELRPFLTSGVLDLYLDQIDAN